MGFGYEQNMGLKNVVGLFKDRVLGLVLSERLMCSIN